MSANSAEITPADKHYFGTGPAELAHVPGDFGLPVLGSALSFLRDPRGLSLRMREKYGPVYKTRYVDQYVVALAGKDALQRVFLDREKNFSSEKGWDHSLGRLFTRGLMLMDFEEHRLHRRIMQAAFKREALENYMGAMNACIARELPAWADDRNFRFYPAIKQLTLNNAASVFLGLELGPEADQINKAFVDSVAAAVSIVRKPVPGLALWKGLRGRRLLSEYFKKLIPERRASDRKDMFTVLCHAVTEDGESFSDQDIIDHMIFLMMAAHDTLTSTLTTCVYSLAANPEWQDRLRRQALASGRADVQYDDLGDMDEFDWTFNEAMRMWAPVPFIPRRTVRDCEFSGIRIPANTQISVSTDAVHYDPELWRDPESFDPLRFSPERAEHKNHPFAFTPFGGGAHKCIGMHFAVILAKIFLHRFLRQYRFTVPDEYTFVVRQLPIPKPSDGLPLTLETLDS